MTATVLLAGCNGALPETNTNKSFDIAFNLQNDSTYRYTVKNNISITQKVDAENTININQNMTLMSAYHVQSENRPDKDLSVTYERITMSSGNQLFSLDYDSETDKGLDPVYEGLRTLIDKTYDITVSKQGEIISSEPVNAGGAIGQSVNGLNDSSMRKIMLHCFKVYPGSAVAIGDIWEKTYATSIGFANVKVRNKYQLISVDKGVAHLEMQGRVSSEHIDEHDANSVELKGIQSGSFDIILETGLVKNGKLSQKLSGKMNITGEMAPVDVESDMFILGITIPAGVK